VKPLVITSETRTHGMRRPCGTVLAARNTLSFAWHQTLAAWKISSARRSGIDYSILALHLPSSCSTWHGTAPWQGLTTAYGDTSSRADGGSTGCDLGPTPGGARRWRRPRVPDVPQHGVFLAAFTSSGVGG